MMLVAEICNTVVTNAVLAACLAIAVALICIRIQRPAIRHLLWVMVLLRLLAPPICVVDLSSQRAWLQQQVLERVAVHQAELQFSYRVHLNAVQKAIDHPNMLPVRSLYAEACDEELETIASAEVATPSPLYMWFIRAGKCVQLALMFLWLAGSVACLSYQLIVIFRFNQRIRKQAYNSRIWQSRAEQLAKRMRLTTCPRIRMVREAISPMLWGVGRKAQILLPDRLFEQLDRRAQDGLLCHELAHYKRADHWVRVLESIAMVAFWWHPVFWWARHEIEKSEEQCCDAMAVAQAFGNRRSYAEALLQAIDFVSAVSLPPISSGAVRNGVLRKRIELIMSKRQGWAERKIGPGLIVFFIAALLPFPLLSSQLAASSSTAVLANSQPSNQILSGSGPTAAVCRSVAARGCVLSTDECHRTVLETRNGKTVDLGVGRVSVSAWSQSQELVAVGATDGRVEILCTHSGNVQADAVVGDSAIACVAFSQDDHVLGIADHSGHFVLIDSSTGAEKLRVNHENARVINLSFENACLTVAWTKRGTLFEETVRFVDGDWSRQLESDAE